MTSLRQNLHQLPLQFEKTSSLEVKHQWEYNNFVSNSYNPLFPDGGTGGGGHRSAGPRDAGNLVRRRRQADSESEEEIGGASVSVHYGGIPAGNEQTAAWSSYLLLGQTTDQPAGLPFQGASYHIVDTAYENQPGITDFFDYGCCLGWEQDGDACTIALCDTPCLYGKCESPNTCTCNRGWTGPTCNDKCELGITSTDCGGPYLCDAQTHNCQCLPGYTGNKCNIPCPVGTYGPGCEGKCECSEHMNDHNTCDRYTGICPIRDQTQVHIKPTSSNSTSKSKNGLNGVASIDIIPTTEEPRFIVHGTFSTMKVVFLSGIAVVALVAVVCGFVYSRRKRRYVVRKGDSFFERKKAWGAMVITELNEVHGRRRKTREAEPLQNIPESAYDNPPTPPSRRHTYLDSILEMDNLSTAIYNGLGQPDGQEADTYTQDTTRSLNTTIDVKSIHIPQEDDSIYEVHQCGAHSSGPTTCLKEVDSIYTNDSVFSIIRRCGDFDTNRLAPVGNAIGNIAASSESEYDYPYADMAAEKEKGLYTATEPRRQRRKRFGSRDRRMRKGSSDGQMYSVLVRPDIETVSYQKQSQSDNLDYTYASRIDLSNGHDYLDRIDSATDLYSAEPRQIKIGSSWYSQPRDSESSHHALPAPEAPYSDFVRNESDSNSRFALGYLTSVRKAPSIPVTPSHHVDYQPPVPDHYQSFETTNSMLKRNLFRHQFQTVHNRPDKPTTISIKKADKLTRPNCLPLDTKPYHGYVNGKMISKPNLPHRHAPALPQAAIRNQGRNPSPRSGTSSNIPSPTDSNSSTPTRLTPTRIAPTPRATRLSPSRTAPTPRARLNFPSPDDLDSDNYLSLRFSEKSHPMKQSTNI